MARKTAAEGEKVQALGKSLRDMFKMLEVRPVPDRLRSVVDQLDEGEGGPLKKSGSR